MALSLTVLPWLIRNFVTSGALYLRHPSIAFAALRIGTGRPFSDSLYQRPFQSPRGLEGREYSVYRKQIVKDYLDDWRKEPLTLLRYRVYQVFRMWTPPAVRIPVSDGPVLVLIARKKYSQLALRSGYSLVFGFLPLGLVAIGIRRTVRRGSAAILLTIYPVILTVLAIPVYADIRFAIFGELLLAPFVAIAIIAVFKRCIERSPLSWQPSS